MEGGPDLQESPMVSRNTGTPKEQQHTP